MAESTGISWTDATFNAWVGCTKVSPGCLGKNCYAETLVTGRMGRAGTWGPKGTRERTSVALWAKPARWNRLAAEGLLPDGTVNPDGHRPRVFCASLADVFEPRPELEPWRADLFDLIAATPNLDWLVLSKRPDVAATWLRAWWDARQPMRMETRNGAGVWEAEGRTWATRDYLGWGVLPNLWVGTSIESTAYTWRADWLRLIPAPVRFISAEPLLASLFTVPGDDRGGHRTPPDAAEGARELQPLGVSASGSTPDVSIEDRAQTGTPGMAPAGTAAQSGAPTPDTAEGATARAERAPLDLTGIDWVIVGGESGGRNARPMHPDWAREIREAVLDRGGWETDCPYGDPECCGETLIPRPALHFKQWGSHDAEGVYRGPAPTAGGKLLDGVAWQEFPSSAAVPA